MSTVYKELPMLPLKNNTAFALGYFDGVHAGHLSVLNSALAMREKGLVPAVFTFSVSSSSPEQKIGNKRIQTLDERIKTLSDLGFEIIFCPDFNYFKHLTAEQFLKEYLIDAFSAKAICCGEDFRFGTGASSGAVDIAKICEDNLAELKVLPQLLYDNLPISSTRIRQAVNVGDMKLAHTLLGRYFSISGEVIHGKKLGRNLNFPTVNQLLPIGSALPKFGVYATMVTLPDGSRYPAATNVGIKPTVGSELPLSESHIIGFDGDLYGQSIVVEFIELLRPEKRFESIEELKSTIANDVENAKELTKDMI